MSSRCSLCNPGMRPLIFCSRHALAIVNRTITDAELELLHDPAEEAAP